MRFGLGFFSGQVPVGSGRSFADEYADTIRLCELAEEVGFDSVWVTEHHGAADGYLPSLTVMLAAIAARTQRVTLAMGVALAPFQHPLRFAEDCAVLDQLSNGRLQVGLAVGWREEEFRSFGIPTRERVRRTVELAEICRLAWTEERFSYSGRHYSYDRVAVTPKPAHDLPIVMGGFVEAALERAGRIADGFIASRGTLDAFRQRVAVFDAAARAARRDPRRALLAMNQYAWVSSDGSFPAEVQATIWNAQGTYAGWAETDTPDRRFQLPPINVDLVEAVAAHGTPEQLTQRLRPWADAFRDRDFEIVVRL